jgi:hypothetical protein
MGLIGTKSCCCCITLRTGCKAIALINLTFRGEKGYKKNQSFGIVLGFEKLI